MLPLLLGCSPAAVDPAPEDAAVVLPSSYEYAPDTTGAASFDQAALESALDALFVSLRDLNAAPVIDSYLSAMAGSDASCPAYYEQDGSAFWYASCTASSGADYDGYAFYTVYEDYDLFEDGTPWDARVLYGTADITSSEGERYHIGGSAYFGDASADGVDLWISAIAGSFFAEDDASAGTWIEDGASPSLTLYAADYTDYGVHILLASGAMALRGELTAAQLSDLIIYTYVPGIYPCAEEPAGTMSVRDAAGNWFSITFDVDPDTLEVMEGGACDGCGTVTQGGEIVGEVCIDASALVDWEVAPW